MALFEGESLIDVDTGDGRTLKVPASVAAQLGLQMPTVEQVGIPEYGIGLPPNTPPPPPPPPPTTQKLGPGGNYMPSETAGPTPAAKVKPSPVAAAPGPIANTKEEPSSVDAVSGPTGEQAPTYINTTKMPAGTPSKKPVTTADLQKDGYAGTVNEYEAAVADAQKAAEAAADVQAIHQQAIAGVIKQRNIENDRLLKEKNQIALESERKYAEKEIEFEAAQKKWADTKIDRSVDHPIMAIISVALSGIGSAMKGESNNPGLDMLMKGIDRKVAAQMQDLERQGKALGMQKDNLERMRTVASDKIALRTLMMAGETERTARVVEEMAARSASDEIKARAQQQVAELREKAAIFRGQAVEKQMAFDLKKEDIAQAERASRRSYAVGMAGIAENKRQFDKRMEFDREKLDADMAKAVMDAQREGNKARVAALDAARKDNEARGIANVATGEYLMQPEGKKLLEDSKKLDTEAAAIEAEAQKQTDPNKAAMLLQRAQMVRTKATDLRVEATTAHVFRDRDPTQAGKTSDLYSASQNITTLTNRIQRIYDSPDGGKSFISTDAGRAEIQAMQTALLMQLKNAWQLGVLSKQDTALINEATGGDATKADVGTIAHALGLEIGTDPDAFKARLKAVKMNVQDGTVNKLKATGYRGGVKDLFNEEAAPTETSNQVSAKIIAGEKTANQLEQGAGGGFVRDLIDTPQNAYGAVKAAATGQDYKSMGDRRAESVDAHPRYIGFTRTAGDEYGKLVQAYKGGDPKAGELLASMVGDSNQKLAHVAMQNLRQDAPELYMVAKKKAAGDLAKQLAYEDQGIERAAPDELTNLVQRTVIGHEGAFEELSRRAATDPVAKQYLQTVIDFRKRRQGN